ncbi:MAG: vWA domain-containing protein [Solirubrobacteraceae bacterium]
MSDGLVQGEDGVWRFAEDEGSFSVETIHLDLPAVVGAFSQRLHEEGVPVTPVQSANWATALTLVKPQSRARLYWTTRAVFVTAVQQLPAFNRVFAEIFVDLDKDQNGDGDPDLIAEEKKKSDSKDADEPPPRSDDMEGGEMNAGDEPGEDEDDDDVSDIPIAQASDEEVLAEKSFSDLEPHELAMLYHLMTRLKLATPTRRLRRVKRQRHGEHIDMRRTLRASLRTGGDPIKLKRRKRRIQARRLVMLCDISGSMEPYARAYLQFLHCARATGPNAEAFVFATRLTRLTKQLAGRNPQRAIRRAAEHAPDWSSGTRIGDALKTFNDKHGRRGMARGAVVVILSDGWERGDPEIVAREMQRLSRLAYRIVWVNPRVSAPGFAPRAGGLRAALPYCNAMVSGHSLKSLDEVADAIAADLEVDAIHTQASWKPPSVDKEPEPEDEWGYAGSGIAGIAMPSGYSPKKGKTAPGRSWAD